MTDGQVAYRLQKLVQSCDHLDVFHDHATAIKNCTEGTSVSGHEWGLVGAIFSINYSSLAADTIRHIGMIESFLAKVEAAMEQTVLNYKGADERIIAHIHALQEDAPEIRAQK